jgi:hypothetical protein
MISPAEIATFLVFLRKRRYHDARGATFGDNEKRADRAYQARVQADNRSRQNPTRHTDEAEYGFA